MIVDIRKLTDFDSNYGILAELEVQSLICKSFKLTPGVITVGYDPTYDFAINNTKLELKFSRNVFDVTKIEIARADKRPSGLSLTQSDLYALFSKDHNGTAKLRLIKTADIYAYYLTRKILNYTIIPPSADSPGRIELPLNIHNINDLCLGICDYEDGLFYLDTFKPDKYAIENITKFIK
jgi:hypothetical protein